MVKSMEPITSLPDFLELMKSAGFIVKDKLERKKSRLFVANWKELYKPGHRHPIDESFARSAHVEHQWDALQDSTVLFCLYNNSLRSVTGDGKAELSVFRFSMPAQPSFQRVKELVTNLGDCVFVSETLGWCLIHQPDPGNLTFRTVPPDLEQPLL